MKSKLHINTDRINKTYFQVLAIEHKNLEATKLKMLQLVCRGSRYEEAAVSLRRFFVELERAEPKVCN